MRNKRAKTYKKLLAAYIRHFGLRAPLQILIDATLAQSLAAMKLRPEEVLNRLESVLQASAALPAGQRPQTFGSASTSKAAAFVKPMITQCAIHELYKAQKNGPTEAKAVELAKSWERRFCNHREAIPADRCMREVIGDTNKHRYVLAANSPALRAAIRNAVPGVPVVHVNDHQVLVLEPMSELTKKRCEELEAAKMEAIAGKATLLGKREAEQEAEGISKMNDEKPESVKPQPPRKKRAKGPNPLSVKKSKKAKALNALGTTVHATRDHKKRKIAA